MASDRVCPIEVTFVGTYKYVSLTNVEQAQQYFGPCVPVETGVKVITSTDGRRHLQTEIDLLEKLSKSSNPFLCRIYSIDNNKYDNNKYEIHMEKYDDTDALDMALSGSMDDN